MVKNSQRHFEHIWFDVGGTLTRQSEELERAHNALRYQTYADVVKRVVDQDLISEYESLYQRYGSNSAAFRSLGHSSDYWQRRLGQLDESLYLKPEPEIIQTLDHLRSIVPISLFTNFQLDRTLRVLHTIGVQSDWFTFILTGDDVPERKPALDGFREIIKKSDASPESVLYVGDRVDVDIKPAKLVGLKTCLVWGESDEADFSFLNFKDILTIA